MRVLPRVATLPAIRPVSDSLPLPMHLPSSVPSALKGIRVLDSSQMLAGPQCAMRLGDLGADVIKIEPPQGEWQRSHSIANSYLDSESTPYLGMNRNKRGITLNLKHSEGREVLYGLVRKSDVFLQNYRVGTAAKLGVDYATLKKINPKLVYCSISGYGQTGPYSRRPGQDLLLQGYSGTMFSSGGKDDPPRPAPFYGADVMASYSACIAILGALMARAHTGEGQEIDVSMFSVMLDCQQQELLTYLNTGKLPPRTEEPLANAWINAPYGVYRTKDAWLTLAMAPLDVLGELLDNDALRAMKDWTHGALHRDQVFRICRAALVTRTTAEWIELFDRHNIWSGPVLNYAELEKDPHVCATSMIVQIPHPNPKIGQYRQANVPVQMSGTPMRIERHAPMLGEHTAEVLSEILGLDEQRIADLRANGIV